MTIADKLTRLSAAHDAIISAINAKGGSATGDGFEDFATDIAAIPSGGTSKNVQIASGTGRATTSTYAAISGQTLTVAKTGTYHVYWAGFRTSTSGTSGSQLYVDGTAYGSPETIFDNHGQAVHLSNVSLTAGQTLTVWARSRGSNYYMYVANLTIVEA